MLEIKGEMPKVKEEIGAHQAKKALCSEGDYQQNEESAYFTWRRY